MGYIAGRGHQHTGPGTSMVQFVPPVARFGDGMGACCSGCSHGGTCSGMGLFESGWDVSGWGWPEMLIAGLGAYMVLSTVFTTSRAVGKVRRLPGERRKRKAAALRARASELTKKK